MEKNGLVGGIPKSLGNASALKAILLSGNGLSGGIPKEVLNLEYLESFNVSYNRLSGKIPAHKVVIPASAFEGNAGLCGKLLPPYQSTTIWLASSNRNILGETGAGQTDKLQHTAATPEVKDCRGGAAVERDHQPTPHRRRGRRRERRERR
ncbi:receptor like protein 22 [Striga hermonthica]|uniref:Receptor like protein 22 n=1 Tax=Striga hermonthica TaxID=68872 RepID=A0A9N7NZ28_STRHE|nr:receptor like protein 22 [Striga hermonthica]